MTILHKLSFAVVFTASALLFMPQATAEDTQHVSKVWNPDNGDGSYRNPVLYSDYSDPDVLRVGDNYYLVSSSFDAIPGLPILHSKDLVHWELIGHALLKQPPIDVYRAPQHGNGVWAPSIRYHAGEFFIFYPDPNYGIYVTKARTILGPWSEPLLIKAAPGWIDPCPLWDDDGKAYLVNGLAASRSGMKSSVVLSQMSVDGTKLLDDGILIIDGHAQDETIEGPKIYKHHGYYYVSAPAGGVPRGWQVVYRSRAINGPYERRVVLAQGSTSINGPHQGAWVDTPEGEDWFLHFRDLGPYGRVVSLEPMHWGSDDWPVIGINQSAAGTGEPVATYRKPKTQGPAANYTPADSDEFNAATIGLQWQWQVNPGSNWAFPSPALGVLRLTNQPAPAADINLYNLPNLLLQKFPGPEFTVTTKLHFSPHYVGDQTGLVIQGSNYSAILLEKTRNGLLLKQVERHRANLDGKATESEPIPVQGDDFYLRAQVKQAAIEDAVVSFSYSLDGTEFHPVGTAFHATTGRWIGAKVGIFALTPAGQNEYEYGYADYDWFRFDR